MNPTKLEETGPLMERLLYEVKKVVVGQDHFLERVLVAILAQGHLLVEGVPGLAKTLMMRPDFFPPSHFLFYQSGCFSGRRYWETRSYSL